MLKTVGTGTGNVHDGNKCSICFRKFLEGDSRGWVFSREIYPTDKKKFKILVVFHLECLEEEYVH